MEYHHSDIWYVWLKILICVQSAFNKTFVHLQHVPIVTEWIYIHYLWSMIILDLVTCNMYAIIQASFSVIYREMIVLVTEYFNFSSWALLGFSLQQIYPKLHFCFCPKHVWCNYPLEQNKWIQYSQLIYFTSTPIDIPSWAPTIANFVKPNKAFRGKSTHLFWDG